MRPRKLSVATRGNRSDVCSISVIGGLKLAGQMAEVEPGDTELKRGPRVWAGCEGVGGIHQ